MRRARHVPSWADGWIPFGLSRRDLGAILDAPALSAAPAGRGDAFDVVLAPEPPLDPAGDPDGAAGAFRAYRAIGATGLSLRLPSESRDHYVEQLAAMQELGAVDAG